MLIYVVLGLNLISVFGLVDFKIEIFYFLFFGDGSSLLSTHLHDVSNFSGRSDHPSIILLYGVEYLLLIQLYIRLLNT